MQLIAIKAPLTLKAFIPAAKKPLKRNKPAKKSDLKKPQEVSLLPTWQTNKGKDRKGREVALDSIVLGEAGIRSDARKKTLLQKGEAVTYLKKQQKSTIKYSFSNERGDEESYFPLGAFTPIHASENGSRTVSYSRHLESAQKLSAVSTESVQRKYRGVVESKTESQETKALHQNNPQAIYIPKSAENQREALQNVQRDSSTDSVRSQYSSIVQQTKVAEIEHKKSPLEQTVANDMTRTIVPAVEIASIGSAFQSISTLRMYAQEKTSVPVQESQPKREQREQYVKQNSVHSPIQESNAVQVREQQTPYVKIEQRQEQVHSYAPSKTIEVRADHPNAVYVSSPSIKHGSEHVQSYATMQSSQSSPALNKVTTQTQHYDTSSKQDQTAQPSYVHHTTQSRTTQHAPYSTSSKENQQPKQVEMEPSSQGLDSLFSFGEADIQSAQVAPQISGEVQASWTMANQRATDMMSMYSSGKMDTSQRGIVDAMKSEIGYKGACCDGRLLQRMTEAHMRG